MVKPPTPYPPSLWCQWCGARAVVYDPDRSYSQARYACGSTAMMLWNDIHLQPGPRLEIARQVNAWKRRLTSAGHPDADLALGADPFNGDEAHARLKAAIYAYASTMTPDQSHRGRRKPKRPTPQTTLSEAVARAGAP